MRQIRFCLMLILLTLIYPVDCISLSILGGSGGSSGTVSMNIDAADSAFVQGDVLVNGADISPSVVTTGELNVFEQTHMVIDSTGKHAKVCVKVVNGRDMKYSSKVSPGEGDVRARRWVSAEEWLTVQDADYIKCAAEASYPVGGLRAGVSTEVFEGSVSGYYNRAYAEDGYVEATQGIQADRRIRRGITSGTTQGITGDEIVINAWSSNEAGSIANYNVDIKGLPVKTFNSLASATKIDVVAYTTGLDKLWS